MSEEPLYFLHGKYYFIATNDADNNHILYIRESDTIPGLVDAEEALILDTARGSEIRRVHFDIDGYPRLDLTEENDLNQELAKAAIDIILK